jgi:hypothetical protein
VLLTSAGCVVAPPARIGGAGAPGRSAAYGGELNLGLWIPTTEADAHGYSGLGFSPAEGWRIEAGTETLFGYPRGYLGLRYNLLQPAAEGRGLTLDLEGGGMAGAGAYGCEQTSDWCGPGDGIWNAQRRSGGGYLGSGVGYHRDWFDLYARTRLQLTAADGLEPAFWYGLQGGLQFNIERRTHVYLATAGSGFVTEGENSTWWAPLEVGIVFTFGGERD